MTKRVTCIFVHGWAMNSAVWEQCLEHLPSWLDVIVVDLPGHGTMTEVSARQLDDYVDTLVPLIHHPVIWVGWSLGGLAVLRLAERYPQRVTAALLVACNPCFVSRENWSSAVDEDIFRQFAANLQLDQKKTIRRFLALQVKGLPDVMSQLRLLQRGVETRGSASSEAMTAGLDILLHTDLREALSSIEPPLHWLLGSNDGLVPAALADVLRDEYAQTQVTLHQGSSHAPFISHSDAFVRLLTEIASPYRR